MRFTSLVVELIRARPRLVVWLVVLAQAGLWLILPMLLYRSPPGDLATALAFGREYQVGTWLGPPLAFWLADIAFRAAGNTMFGVYLLAQACAVATFWIYYQLARAIVGGQQAVLAVLLSLTVVAFSSPGVEFGPRRCVHRVRILAIAVVQLGHIGRVDTLEVVSLHGSGLKLSPIAELYREIRPPWPPALDSAGR